MSYRKDLITGIILAIFSIAYFAYTFTITLFTGSGSTPLDARFVPQMWSIFLFILSAALVVRGLKAKKQAAASGEVQATAINLKEIYQNNYEVILTFVALFIYIVLMKSVGFLIMSALFVFSEALILSKPGKRNIVAAAITGIVASVVINYVFVVLLSIMLPKGILGF